MFQRQLHFLILISILFLICPLHSRAENGELPFRRISPAGGFTLSPVIEIAQDKEGFIWFITREKLYQYNSQDFISFEPKYQSGISHTNNYVTSMLIDRSNSIWVGTNAGAAKFNKHDWKMEAIRLIDKEMPDKVLFPTDIRQNKKGEIWMIESNYLALVDTVSLELKYVQRNNLRIRVNAFCFDQDHIYAVNSSGEMYEVNTGTLETKKLSVDLSPVKIFGIYLIDNVLWISTDGFGLRRYTKEGSLIGSYFAKEDAKADSYSNRIRSVLKTSEGKIWIATYKGLIEWKDGNLNQYASDLTNPFTLPDNSISSLMEDKQKGL